ncbi:MAG: acetyl-CoA carboxylase carboxyltransferase subunit alpha [Kiritimatiellaeota bacterium]|nr:acetyl-CoA carboxylase carboxyltransferase subunit alpha [Kiritimatiellota bacterium]
MAAYALPFEKPLAELNRKLEELRGFGRKQNVDVAADLAQMERKIAETREKIFAQLTPWQIVQVARHPLRPYALDYVREMFVDFSELHGDRIHRDDRAIFGGLAKLGEHRVMVIGTQKGRDTKGNLEVNFGCAYPEGYRKALRLMRLAAKFNLPIITLIDTPGAYPGIESEERHIAEAIAVNLREMFTFAVPMLVTIIGEGGSGGALGIGVGDRVLMLQYAYYSVISPEGCAAILWKNRSYADRAAAALKITSRDLLAMKLADEIVPEPLGGAHVDPRQMGATLKQILLRHLLELKQVPPDELLERRYAKFRAMGVFAEQPAAAAAPVAAPGAAVQP